jgi:DNA-binding XRE family transcriptional regulator
MKRAEQLHHVQQWKESGLTQRTYCEKIGVKRTTFANWVARSREETTNGFLAIAPLVEPISESIEIIYPNGVRLKTTSSSIAILSELIHRW